MVIMGVLLFAGAFALTAYVFAATLVPAMSRIAAVLRGQEYMTVAPLRISERRRPAYRMVPAPTRASVLREAA